MAMPSLKLKTFYERSPIAVQNLMSSVFGVIKRLDERGPLFRKIFRELEETQWWDRERLRALQIERLRNILRFAQEHVPFYGKSFAEYGVSWRQVSSMEDVRKFPMVTKEDLRSRRQELIPDVAPDSRVLRMSTSGTTGSPIEVLFTHRTLVAERAWVVRHRTWGGYDPRKWRGTFGGYRIVPIQQNEPPFWRFNVPWRQIHFSTLHMSARNLRFYAEALRRYRVEYLDGYPSTLYLMARYLLNNGQTIPMRAVFTGSEPVTEVYREAMEKAFACKVFDFYSMTEKVAGAGECEQHNGYHVCMEHVVVEVAPLGPESEYGKDIAGEVVGTSLVNTAMPLIRYRLGDVAAAAPAACACGRGLELIGQVTSRLRDIIVCPDGRHVSACSLTHPFKPIHSIEESQLIQETLTDVIVRIVRRPNYTKADERRLEEGLRERLGPDVRLHFEYVEKIPRTATGKFAAVISKVSTELWGPSEHSTAGQ